MAFIVNNNTILISDGDQLVDGVFDNVQIGKRIEGVETTVYVLVHDGAGTVTLQNVTIDETNVLDNVVNITDGTTAHQLNRGDLITYTAALGVDITQLNGTVTIGHTNTSDQASVITPEGTVISNIQLDTFGHITLLDTFNLDNRYYTETEADARFINVTGDTMTGPLVLQDTLTVAGTTTLNGNTTVNANLDVNATTIDLTGTTTLTGNLTHNGNSDLNGTLDVSGLSTLNSLAVTNNATVGGTLDVTGATTMRSTVDILGTTVIDAPLTVNENTHFLTNIDVDGETNTNSLNVEGVATINGMLTLNGDLGVQGSTQIWGVTRLYDNFYIGSAEVFSVDDDTGNTYIAGNLQVDGTTSMQGSVNVSDIGAQTVTTGTLTTTDWANIGTTLTVGDATTLNHTLTVQNLTSLNGGLTMDGGQFTVADNTGNVATQGNLYVGGTTTLVGDTTASNIYSETVTISGTLTTSGTAPTEFNTPTTVNNTLTVTGLTTLNGGLTMDGGTVTISDTTGNIYTAGTLQVGSNTLLQGTLTTTGATQLNSTLGVQSATTLNSTLTVGGHTQLNNTLTTTGLASLDGGIDVNGLITVDPLNGNTYTSGTLTVIGTSEFTGNMTAGNIDSATLDTTGAVSVGTTLDVTGLSSLDGGIDMNGLMTVDQLTGNIWTNGTLQVVGTTDLTGDLTGTSADFNTLVTHISLLNEGTLTTNGHVQNNTTMTTEGAALFNGGVDFLANNGNTFTFNDADGSITQDGTFSVTDASYFTGLISAVDIDASTLDTSGNVGIGGTLTVGGLTTLYGGLTADGGVFTVANDTGSVYTQGTLQVDSQTYLNNTTTLSGGVGEKFSVTDGTTEKFRVESTTGNIWTAGTISGPTNFTIDPASDGGTLGTLIVDGNLQVTGTTTTINSTEVAITDLNMTVAKDATTPAAANGGGITVAGANATLTYNATSDAWVSNKEFIVQGDIQTNDGNKLLMGTGDDLQIWHDGTNSRIDSNTGLLQINGQTGTQILDNDGSVQINVVEDGAVSLAYNGSVKLATKTDGIDITGRLDVSEDIRARTVTVWGNDGFIMEDGVSRITHNDGGGNAQIRFGHDYSTADERFTHAGTAFYIGGDLDTAAGKLTLKVASNGGAGNDAAVTWGPELNILGDNITWNGSRILTTADEGPGNNLDADTLDGYQHGDFMKTGENTTTSGDIIANGFISTEDAVGARPLSYKNDAWPIILQTSTRGGLAITSADDSIYIGNGDVAHTIDPTYFDPAAELVGLGSDSDIRIFSGLQNGWGTHNTFEFRSDGQLYGTVNGAGTSLYWNSLNDGSGSGLDADLLDGRQYSWFQKRVAIQVSAPTGELPADLWWDSEEGTLKIFYQNTWVEASPPANSLAQGIGSGLDADKLDGQEGTYYLNYNNFTNKPTIGNATVTISAGAGLSTGGSFTTNQTSNQTITLDHADTSSVANLSSNNSAGTVIQDIAFTYDGYGHVTGSSVTTTNLDGRYYTESEANSLFHPYGGSLGIGFNADSVYVDNWFRSYGATGWYAQDYGGGMHMTDTTYVRVYNGKRLYVANHIMASGDVYAYYSDERLKTKVGIIDSPLEKVKSLNAFKYINNDRAKALGYEGEEVQVGLSAQEVKAVMPEIVSRAPADIEVLEDGTEVSKTGEDYMTVNYAKLTPLLIEAVKELTAKVEAMQEEINQLRGEK